MITLQEQPKLTSAEIAALWTQYMNETAGMIFNRMIRKHVVDAEIKDLFDYAIQLGTRHLEQIRQFLRKEHYPVPVGFTDRDADFDAPRLFTDILSLHYINILSIHGCHGYSGALTTASRQDVRGYFTACNASAIELCNRSKDLLINKGLYFRPAVLQPPEQVDYVDSESFLTGWFGDKRPLSCIEMTDILFNLKKSILAKAVTVAFSQVAESDKVRDFLLKAADTKEQHISMFSQVLNEDSLPAPPTLESEITNSTRPPFSDKLMMFHVGFLFSTAMVYYGSGLASSPRRDLAPKYLKAIGDDMKVGGEWLELMIDNKWMEQPPLAEDRKALAMAGK